VKASDLTFNLCYVAQCCSFIVVVVVVMLIKATAAMTGWADYARRVREPSNSYKHSAGRYEGKVEPGYEGIDGRII
jgi:hypothetical protein